MLLKASEKYDIDFTKSFMIGDRVSDIYAGNSVGCQTIQLVGNMSDAPQIESPHFKNNSYLKPNFRTDSLLEALEYIKEANQ